MYWAKHLALEPLVIGFPATSQDGIGTSFNPALFTSAVIAEGVMSGVPVICCCFSSVLTVLFPMTASTITDDTEGDQHTPGHDPADPEDPLPRHDQPPSSDPATPSASLAKAQSKCNRWSPDLTVCTDEACPLRTLSPPTSPLLPIVKPHGGRVPPAVRIGRFPSRRRAELAIPSVPRSGVFPAPCRRGDADARRPWGRLSLVRRESIARPCAS